MPASWLDVRRKYDRSAIDRWRVQLLCCETTHSVAGQACVRVSRASRLLFVCMCARVCGLDARGLLAYQRFAFVGGRTLPAAASVRTDVAQSPVCRCTSSSSQLTGPTTYVVSKWVGVSEGGWFDAMLDPSSSEEDEDEREVTPPRRPGIPAAAAAAMPPAAAAMTPARRRAYADDVSRSESVGTAATGFAPAISVDQRSMSTASRVSYEDSGDNTSITGTASPGGPLSHPHRPSASSLPPPPSPSLSASSPGAEAGLSDQDRSEDERRRSMQIYVFVIRCIAYPFNAKQPTDMVRRQVKVNRQQMHSIRERFQVTLCSATHIHLLYNFV